MVSTQRFVAGAIFLLALDALWIRLNYAAYKRGTEAVQGMPMKVKITPAVLSYGLLLITLWGILSYVEETRQSHSRAYYATVAFFIGIVIYGVYNTTNAALLTNYNTLLAVQDTIWGGVLLATTTTVALALYSI